MHTVPSSFSSLLIICFACVFLLRTIWHFDTGSIRVTRFTHCVLLRTVLNRDWGGSGRLTGDSLRLNYFSHSSTNNRTYARWDESINLKPE